MHLSFLIKLLLHLLGLALNVLNLESDLVSLETLSRLRVPPQFQDLLDDCVSELNISVLFFCLGKL